MTWVEKASTVDFYKIIIGSNLNAPLTSYVPDQYMDVSVQVTEYDMRYRGLLLYATDSSNTKVGDWVVFEDYPINFQANEVCPKSVLHYGADIKPFVSTFKFKAPAGTGSITFQALIKYGDANTGTFYWPKDVTISEGSPLPDQTTWILAGDGQSCREFCTSKDLYCDSDALYGISTQQLLIENIDGNYPCKQPYLTSCLSGATIDQNFCYYNPGETICESENRDYAPPSCSGHNNTAEGSRFCVCSSNRHADKDPNSSASLSASLFGILLALFLSLRSNNSKTLVVLLFCFIVVFSNGVSAHNWINSPSRSPVASTFKPCLTKSTSKPHVQVGPGQYFQVEWMVGHQSRLTYFILVSAKNEANLTQHKFSMLDDYLNNAPANTNPTIMKYHRRKDTTGDASLYKQLIDSSNPNYFARPAEFTRTGPYLYSYLDSMLTNDLIAAYDNPNYPWIMFVRKYEHSIEKPSEFDVAQFKIPDGAPFGKYILHYMWAGYYDCIDIDYINQQVTNIYGLDDPTIPTTYTRIDHCYFPEIQRVLYSPSGPYRIVENNDPTVCLEDCRLKADCQHVQILPLRPPSTANPAFSDYSSLYQTLDLDRYNTTYPFIKDLPDDTLVCYNLAPRAATETEGIYIVSLDPSDPAFYATCYVQNNKLKFIGYEDTAVAKIETPWVFGDKCISCEDRKKIQTSDYMVPTWRITTDCRNCDVEDDKGEYPGTDIQFSLVRNNSYCDGFQYDGQADNFNNPSTAHHKTCTDGTRCLKRLNFTHGERTTVSIKACAHAVMADDECSDIFMKYTATGQDFYDYRHYCYCYTKPDCCHGCSPSGDRANWAIFQVKDVAKDPFQPDPTCATGELSFDGTACCSGTCGYGQCRDYSGSNPAYGFCCSTCIPRSCKEYGPPCLM
jgi:hypothetical protein